MIEGSGSVHLTNGSGSRRPKKHMDPTDPDPQHCNQERIIFFFKNKPEVFLVKLFGLLAGAETASRHNETAT
jgi:hypothetical protein